MGCCSVCGKPDCKAFLFMPSNVFVFLCDRHAVKRMGSDSNIPIGDWVESQKKDYESFKALAKMLDEMREDGKIKNN